MPYFLGFDVSKNTLDACLVDHLGAKQWHEKLPNTEQEIYEYLLTSEGALGPFTAVCESTGTYHFTLEAACLALGIPVVVLNPLASKQAVKYSLRGSKTDKTDALAIARVGARGDGRESVPEPHADLKYLVRSRAELTGLATAFTLHALHARERLGALDPATDALLTEVEQSLKALRACLARDAGNSAPKDTFQLLQTIPGIGPVTSATIIGELGDAARFHDAKALSAFAGLNPRVYQSGKALRHTGHLAKRGSPYLRHALFCAAHSARRSDPNFRALFDKKRAEGKTYTEAVCIVSRKLLQVARAVWISGQGYDAAYAASHQKSA